MSGEMASATGMQGIDDLTIIPSDFLKDILNSTSSAMSTSSSSLSTRDWGVHNKTIEFGGSGSLSIKQVLLWGGVGLLGWWLIRKIRGK